LHRREVDQVRFAIAGRADPGSDVLRAEVGIAPRARARLFIFQRAA
jgi:hypothetical protein